MLAKGMTCFNKHLAPRTLFLLLTAIIRLITIHKHRQARYSIRLLSLYIIIIPSTIILLLYLNIISEDINLTMRLKFWKINKRDYFS